MSVGRRGCRSEGRWEVGIPGLDSTQRRPVVPVPCPLLSSSAQSHPFPLQCHPGGPQTRVLTFPFLLKCELNAVTIQPVLHTYRLTPGGKCVCMKTRGSHSGQGGESTGAHSWIDEVFYPCDGIASVRERNGVLRPGTTWTLKTC